MLNERQRGFTLIELLIGMVIGMVVVAAVTNVLISSNHMNLDTLRMIRFNQELRSVMGLIVSDLRRAGFNGTAVALIGQEGPPTLLTSPFATITQGTVTTANDCMLYTYDDSTNTATNGDGALNGSEQYGFKLSGGAVQRLATTAATTVCNGSGWQSLTDTSDLTVNSLSFVFTDHEICQTTYNGMHVQSVTVQLQATSTRVANLTRTLTETVKTRNNRYQYHAAADCTNT